MNENEAIQDELDQLEQLLHRIADAGWQVSALMVKNGRITELRGDKRLAVPVPDRSKPAGTTLH